MATALKNHVHPVNPVIRRRRTLFPLSGRAVHGVRVRLAGELAGQGMTARAIRQVLKCSGPDEARRLCAKAGKLPVAMMGKIVPVDFQHFGQ